MGIQDPSPRSTIGVGKYKTWTPGPWTPSADRVHQNMDRVHGPPFMDQVQSMDPVHILMDPVHGWGPWTRGPCFVLSPIIIIIIIGVMCLKQKQLLS